MIHICRRFIYDYYTGDHSGWMSQGDRYQETRVTARRAQANRVRSVCSEQKVVIVLYIQL